MTRRAFVAGAVAASIAPRFATAAVPTDLAFYRPALDVIWEAFGKDRVMFGSNWPVNAPFAPLAVVHQLAVDYGRGKGGDSLTRLMWANARTVYKLKGYP